MIEMKVEWAPHGNKFYAKRKVSFDEQRLSFIETVAPTPWKGKTNYSTYAILDAEGKKIATLPDGTKDTTVDGGYLRDLFVVAPQLLAEVLRLQKLEAAVVGSWMETINRGSNWHKQLRHPCVELGYLTFDGDRYELSKEYRDMAKQWVRENYGDEEE